MPVQELQAFDGAGVTFRLVLDSGDRPARHILTWTHREGERGRRECGSYLEAVEHASRVVTARSAGQRLTS